MNKLYLIQNQEEFQGEKYLLKSKEYFEGWYFKFIGEDGAIAIIPGIHLNTNQKKAFIQIITENESYYIPYDMKDFKIQYHPFQLQIGANYFSAEKITLYMNHEEYQLFLEGELTFSNSYSIQKNWYQPNIMGPFSYLSFLECNHAIVSMKNVTNGSFWLNDKIFNFNGGLGYIEKDWGVSFPKKYIWCQGNHFQTENASFMLAIATVPLFFFKMKGLICVFLYNGKEYRFSTYNFAKIKKFHVNDKEVEIILKKGKYTLSIQSVCDSAQKLVAPVKGKMEKEILESITATMIVTLRCKNQILFSDICNSCGLEIVK